VLQELVRPLRDLDWDNLEDVSGVSAQVLQDLADHPDALKGALLALPDRPELATMCEHYDILDKAVLYNDPVTGFRVRLHVFLPGYFDRPHNHRWTYASRIMEGGYRHVLYGTDERFDDGVDPRKLAPLLLTRVNAGDMYTLHHSMIHAITDAVPHTTTLVLRGPAVKDRFVVTDRHTGESWWQYGNKHEDPAVAKAKRMTPERLTQVTDRVLSGQALLMS
jgi:predicted metal-dependent enzyme (double-stranded beta helix superfamily)